MAPNCPTSRCLIFGSSSSLQRSSPGSFRSCRCDSRIQEVDSWLPSLLLPYMSSAMSYSAMEEAFCSRGDGDQLDLKFLPADMESASLSPRRLTTSLLMRQPNR